MCALEMIDYLRGIIVDIMLWVISVEELNA